MNSCKDRRADARKYLTDVAGLSSRGRLDPREHTEDIARAIQLLKDAGWEDEAHGERSGATISSIGAIGVALYDWRDYRNAQKVLVASLEIGPNAHVLRHLTYLSVMFGQDRNLSIVNRHSPDADLRRLGRYCGGVLSADREFVSEMLDGSFATNPCETDGAWVGHVSDAIFMLQSATELAGVEKVMECAALLERCMLDVMGVDEVRWETIGSIDAYLLDMVERLGTLYLIAAEIEARSGTGGKEWLRKLEATVTALRAGGLGTRRLTSMAVLQGTPVAGRIEGTDD